MEASEAIKGRVPNTVVRDTCLAVGASLGLAIVVGTMWFLFPVLLLFLRENFGFSVRAPILMSFPFLAAAAAGFLANWLIRRLNERNATMWAVPLVTLGTLFGVGLWWIGLSGAGGSVLVFGSLMGVGMGVVLVTALTSLVTLFRNGRTVLAGVAAAGAGLGVFILVSFWPITFALGLLSHPKFSVEGLNPTVALPGPVFLIIAFGLALVVLGISVFLTLRFARSPTIVVGAIALGSVLALLVIPAIMGSLGFLSSGVPISEFRTVVIVWPWMDLKELPGAFATIFIKLPQTVIGETGFLVVLAFSGLFSVFGLLTAMFLMVAGLSLGPSDLGRASAEPVGPRRAVWVLGAALVGAISLGWLVNVVTSFAPSYERSLPAVSVTSFAVTVGAIVATVLGGRFSFTRMLRLGFGILGGAVLIGSIGLSLVRTADPATQERILLLSSGLVGLGLGATLVLVLRALNQVPAFPRIAASSALVIAGYAVGAVVGIFIPGLMVGRSGGIGPSMFVLALLGLIVVVAGMRIARATEQTDMATNSRPV